MKAKVLELIKELGFNIKSTGHAYGLDYEGVRIQAENEDLRINAWVESKIFTVQIVSGLHEADDAYFHFEEGKAPNLHFREYAPELFELARRFASVAGFEI